MSGALRKTMVYPAWPRTVVGMTTTMTATTKSTLTMRQLPVTSIDSHRPVASVVRQHVPGWASADHDHSPAHLQRGQDDR